MGTAEEAPLVDRLRPWLLQDDEEGEDEVICLAWGKSEDTKVEGTQEGEEEQDEDDEEEEEEEEGDEGEQEEGEGGDEGVAIPWAEGEAVSDAIALLQRQEDVTSNPVAMGRLLHVATRAGLVGVVKGLVDGSGAGVEVEGAWAGEGGHVFVTKPVLVAAECGCEEVLRLLVGRGADVEARDSDGCSLLHAAATGGNPDIVRYVVRDLGLSVALADESGCTALHTSVTAHCPDVARLLASELGADVEACDGDGWRALHYAAVGGQGDLVRFFVTEKKAELAAVTENEGCLPLHYASRQGHLGVVRFLLDEMDEEDGAAMDHEGWSAITYAAAEAWEHVVRFLVGRLGVSPLLIADVEGRSGASLVQDSCHLQLEAYINKVVKFHTAAYRLPGDVLLSDDAKAEEGPGTHRPETSENPEKPRVVSCRLASGANRRTPLVALLYPSAAQAQEGLEARRERHANLHHPALQQYMGRVVEGEGEGEGEEESKGFIMEAPPKLTLSQHLEQQGGEGGRWAEAARLAEAALEAIEVLHCHGLVHGAVQGMESFSVRSGQLVLDMTASYLRVPTSKEADVRAVGGVLAGLEAWAKGAGEVGVGFEEVGECARLCVEGGVGVEAREVRKRLRRGRERRGEVGSEGEDRGKARRGCGDAACRDERCRT